MSERNHTQVDNDSVQVVARVAGALYLVIIVIGVLGEAVIRNSLIVWGDPAATAQRIRESESLWQLGVAGQLVLLLCAVALTAIWYVLLRPVNKNLTVMAVCFALVSLAVESVSALYLQAALDPITSAHYLKGIGSQQIDALTYMAVVAHANTFGVALIFFGVECLIVGYLVRKSGYLPKAIGVMMQIAGVCYLINSFSLILNPPLAALLFPAILLPAFIGESAFCLWLLFKGVDVPAWERKARGQAQDDSLAPEHGRYLAGTK